MCSFILQAGILESWEQWCLLGLWSRKYLSLPVSSFAVALRPSIHSAHLMLMQNLIYEFCYINSFFFHPIHCSEEIISIPSYVSELGFMSPSHRLWYFLFAHRLFSRLVLASLLWDWPRTVGKLQNSSFPTHCISDYCWDIEQTIYTIVGVIIMQVFNDIYYQWTLTFARIMSMEVQNIIW